MTRYSYTSRRAPTKRVEQTHAIWRGIGCLLMLVVPVMAWILASVTVSVGLRNGWPLPYQLLGYPVMPAALWQLRVLIPVLNFIQSQPNLYMVLVFTIAYIVVMSAILSFGYSIAYRFVGPPRYGPLDLPQPEIKVGRYKR